MNVVRTVTFTTVSRPSVNKTADKIREFSCLEQGWSYGEGVPVSQDNISRAMKILQLMQMTGIPATDAFPGLSGEVAVTGYKDDFFVQFVVERDDTYSVLIKKGDHIVARDYHVEEYAARNQFLKSSREIWGISEGLISKGTTTLASAESTPWRSGIQSSRPEYRFSYASA